MDCVPEEAGVGDSEQVEGLLSWLGDGPTSFVRIADCRRLGRDQPTATQPTDQPRRPRKLQITFGSPAMLDTMLSKGVRDSLRLPDCPPAFHKSFLGPSRTAEERRLLFALRQRRREINQPIPEEEDQWFIHTNRRLGPALVRRCKGHPDWNGPGDPGWPQFRDNLLSAL
jgi:hypothetical protein